MLECAAQVWRLHSRSDSWQRYGAGTGGQCVAGVGISRECGVAAGGGDTAAASGEPVEHVAGSSVGYTKTQIANLFVAVDFSGFAPSDACGGCGGRRPAVYACGHCHQPSGLGRPENRIGGLPAADMEEQMADFRNDLRRSSEPRMGRSRMILVAKAASAEEIRVASEYFAALKPWKGPGWWRRTRSR